MTKAVQITISGPSIDETVVFRDFPVRIGRDAGCECRLGYPLVSRCHAKLDFRGDDLVLSDEGSTYGTHVRGRTERVRAPVLLAEVGHEFQIGTLTFRVAVLGPDTGRGAPRATADASPAATTVSGDVPAPDATRSYSEAQVDPEKMDVEAALALLRRDLAEHRIHVRDRVLEGLAAVEESKRSASLRELVRTFPELLQVPEIAGLATASGVVSAHPDAALAAHAALETFRARYLERSPSLDSPERIEAFMTRLDEGWRCIVLGAANLLFAYDVERNQITARPMPERLAAMLLESEEQIALVRRAFDRMVVNHRRLISETMDGVRKLLDDLSPGGFEPIGFRIFRDRARWSAYRRRHDELSRLDAPAVTRLFGAVFGRVFAAMREEQAPAGMAGNNEGAEEHGPRFPMVSGPTLEEAAT